MEWKEIPDFFGYEVNQSGEVRNKHGEAATTYIDRRGYVCIRKTAHIRVHRAVMLAFKPEGKKADLVRHLDGDPANNNINNLAWGTYKENYQDMIAHGGTCSFISSDGQNIYALKGTQSPRSKLKDDDIRTIRKRALKESNKKISEDYPVSYDTICRIVRGEDWSHIK